MKASVRLAGHLFRLSSSLCLFAVFRIFYLLSLCLNVALSIYLSIDQSIFEPPPLPPRKWRPRRCSQPAAAQRAAAAPLLCILWLCTLYNIFLRFLVLDLEHGVMSYLSSSSGNLPSSWCVLSICEWVDVVGYVNEIVHFNQLHS